MAAARAHWRRSSRRRLRASRHAQRPAYGRLRRRTGEDSLPGYTVGISSKGCVTFSPAQDHRLRVVSSEPRWRADRSGLALHDEPRRLHDTGTEEEWTLSVLHSAEDADTYVAAFEEMAHDLVA